MKTLTPPLKTLVPALALGALSLLAGCGGGGGGSSSSGIIDPRLVGNFKETSVATSAQTSACPASVTDSAGNTSSCGSDDTLVLSGDGTFTDTEALNNGSPIGGRWRLDGSTLRLALTSPAELAGDSETFTATLTDSGNTLTLTNGIATADGKTVTEVDGDKDIYTRQ